MTKSRPSCNPAVPPPPVTGAAVGIGLGVGLGVGDGVGDVEADADSLAEALVLALSLALLLSPADVLAEPDSVGGNTDVPDPPEVQAETTPETSTAKMAQPTAVSVALRAIVAIAVRTFIEPPHAPGRCRSFLRSRYQKPAPERKRVADPGAARVGRRQVPESAGDHNSKTHGRHRHAMARAPFKYYAT
jgi:hypothetical protein